MPHIPTTCRKISPIRIIPTHTLTGTILIPSMLNIDYVVWVWGSVSCSLVCERVYSSLCACMGVIFWGSLLRVIFCETLTFCTVSICGSSFGTAYLNLHWLILSLITHHNITPYVGQPWGPSGYLQQSGPVQILQSRDSTELHRFIHGIIAMTN